MVWFLRQDMGSPANIAYAVLLFLWGSSALAAWKDLKPIAETPAFVDVMGPLLRVIPRGARWPRWVIRSLDADLCPRLVPVSEAYMEWVGDFLILRDRRMPIPGVKLGEGEKAIEARSWFLERQVKVEGFDPYPI